MRLPINSIGAAVGAVLALPGLAAAQTQITVGLPTSPPNVVHMPVIIAQELGLYKKYGLDVKTVSLPGGVHVFRAVLSGNVDVGLSPASVTLVARSKGSPAKMLSANLQKFEASMVVRDNIKTMADLKGKRIGIQEPGGFADTISKGVLRAAKVDVKDVNFVSIATEDVPALVANQVDTAILHVEQEMLAKEKVPSIHAIARMWEIQPQNLYTVAVATEKSIKEKPQAMQAFVTATIEATRVLYSDKKKVMPIIVKHSGYPEKIVSETYDFMVKECIWDANSGLSPERVKFTADLMTRVGNIEQGKTPTYEDATELSFAKKAIADLGEWKGPVCPSAAF
jgi:NitT/TauT family transport system substrate-binding protein